jgi:magnesium chelatase family protein
MAAEGRVKFYRFQVSTPLRDDSQLATILPEMTLAAAIETTRLHRVAGLTGRYTALITTRPFRAPHHTIADVGLIGRGQVPMPGEGSRAHHGILFLDELPEFKRHVLEVLRHHRGECSMNTISRASSTSPRWRESPSGS